jgi:hypothetical protein
MSIYRKPLWALAFSAAAAGASAETYVPHLYGVPAGYTQMVVNGAGNNGMMAGYATSAGIDNAATLTNSGFRNLHPSGFVSSRITNSWGGTYHVGYGSPTGSGGISHALFWVGGGPGVDLHPTDASVLQTRGLGGDGQLQCGYAALAASQKACTWSRTAASFRYLNAPNHHQVAAYGADTSATPVGTIWYCGSGINNSTFETCALLWQGQNSNALDLQVTGYTASEAFGCSYPQIAGYTSGSPTGNNHHAALWDINIPFLEDLNPPPFVSSEALAVRGGVQVGFGVPTSTQTRNQALLWHGHAGTWTNLHALLPYPFTLWSSKATDIDQQGNVVGYVESSDHTIRRPVVWLRQ